MATTSIPNRWKYDVFVSFRGEDIRKSFMDHMFNDFKRKGIHAFSDDRELPKGEEISPQLYKAIEESRFLIVIFSKNYASSTWCLRELVKILECKQIEDPKHEVRIIFYDAKPDVVRKRKRSYAKAFAKHDVSNRTEVDKWKEALSIAANLSGWDLQDMTNGFESKFIDSISREIVKTLFDGPLHVGENLVGIDFHLHKLGLARFIGSDKVNMIGICGISGIGKTTLAKAIYKLMYVHFEGSCFCEEVRKQQDLTQVQMHLINKILKTEDLKISCVGEGSTVIKQRMACKPILLVLDDVDHRDQLKALAGSASWFCPGSLIIFTGKDKQLLGSHRVGQIHDMDFLNKDQSLQLFSSYAFEEKCPSTGFQELAVKAVNYVHGHPLALIVLGCFLYGKTMGQWVSELERLKLHPNEEIQRALRLSYDGLNLEQQNILLDIACLFVGENKDFVESVLDGCNFFAVTNMQVLVDKSLITISSNNSLQMHDLIQAMAREIVREESSVTGKPRRLWNSSEVYKVLSEKKVPITEEVEVLVLSLEKFSQKVHIDAIDFAHMKKLRILKIYQEEKVYEQKLELKGHNVIFSGNPYYLSNELSLFYWHGCPFRYLPSDFYPENIVAIDLSYSNIKHFWTTPKCFRRLKVMKLRYCCNLTTTPDFSEITNLEELDLEGCVNLVSVHPSIGMLKGLAVLNLRDCKRLQNFAGGQGRIQPRWWTSITAPFGLLSKQLHPQRSVSLEGLHMLKRLNLSYCNLEQVPESIGGLSCLKSLDLEGNNLLEVPESIGGLSCLEELYLERNNLLEVPESIGGLSCLNRLDLRGNNLLEVPESIGGLSCLYNLNLEGNNFTSLPGSLSQLSHLQYLFVDGCKKLEVLPELPHSLNQLFASDCTSLREVQYRRLSDLTQCPKHLYASSFISQQRFESFSNCPKLFKNVTIDSEGSISKTQCLDSSITSQGFIHQLSAFLGLLGFQTNMCEFFLQGIGYNSLDIGYHGNSIPEWFTNRSKGKHVKVELPSDWCYDKFRGYGTCVVFKTKKPQKLKGYSLKNFDGASLRTIHNNSHKIRDYFEKEVIGIQDSYMIWLRYTRDPRLDWKEAKNFVTFCFEENNEDIEVKEFGVRLICDEDLQQEENVTNLMFPDSTLSQHGGAISYNGPSGFIHWSC